jgi:hypothetical protein
MLVIRAGADSWDRMGQDGTGWDTAGHSTLVDLAKYDHAGELSLGITRD